MGARLYSDLMDGLHAASLNRAESAAVIGGVVHRTTLIAERLVFLDDPDETRTSRGHVFVSERAKFALYERLSAEGLSIVATAHTHPGKWVGLSETDYENQISARVGVWSIIAPQFAASRPVHPRTLGAHIRMPEGWLSLGVDEIEQYLTVTTGS